MTEPITRLPRVSTRTRYKILSILFLTVALIRLYLWLSLGSGWTGIGITILYAIGAVIMATGYIGSAKEGADPISEAVDE